MTQYTKFTKNPISENYAQTHSNIKISLPNNISENKLSNSPSAINSTPTSKMVNSSVNLDQIGVNLNGNNPRIASNTSHNVFSKPLFISNFNSPQNNYSSNKNERVKSSSILRSNTVKHSKNNLECLTSFNQNQNSFNFINNANFSSKNVDINLNEINGNDNTPRQNKKYLKTSNLNQHNFSIDGSKKDFLTVLSNIHRASSINLGREKTNLSSYFSTSPNIYAKNYSTESVNSINNANSIMQREKTFNNINGNLKNSDSSLNLSSFSNNFSNNNNNNNNFNTNSQNLKPTNRRHQTVSFKHNVKNYNSAEGHSINNLLNGNNQNHNGIDIKTIGKNNDNYGSNNFESNNLLLNEIQFSPKFVVNQNDVNNRVNNMKIFDSNLNLNFINNKKNINPQIKKLAQKYESVELVNMTSLNEDKDKLKFFGQKENKLNNINTINNKIEDVNELEANNNKLESEINKIKSNENGINKREDEKDRISDDEDEDKYSTSKMPLVEKQAQENVVKKRDSFSNNTKFDSKAIINSPGKKNSFNEEHTELFGLNPNNNNHSNTITNTTNNNINNNNSFQKINKLEINLEKFEPIRKPNYYSQTRLENHHNNKNNKFNNRQFISSVVQSIANNPSATALNQNSNYRMNKNSLDFIIVPNQSSMNNTEANKLQENTNNNKHKLIRSNSKISYISRDVNDSYAYTNVQQYIEENDLMPPEKCQSIKRWIKDVNSWCDDWEKRTIELSIEENYNAL